MLTRRSFLGSAAGAALIAPFAGFGRGRADAGPIFRFGVIADPQYAPFPPRGTRYYANSLWKVSEAVADFNRQDIEFVATLGDIIDRRWESFGHVLPVYDALIAPSYFILGNHDYSVGSDYIASVERATGLKRSYYDYSGGGHRFLVLDGNDVSVFANPQGRELRALAEERLAKLIEAGAPNAKTWNGGLSEAQFAWIDATMSAAKAAGERVIVQCHYPVHPFGELCLWDSAKLVDLLTSYDNFVLYMNGHDHAGNYGKIGAAHFLNFKGMVETAATTAYATVEVWDDRIEVVGKGAEASRTLPL